jgi:hypothetical protein
LARSEILERERRWARPAAIAAILAAPLYIGSVALDQASDVPSTGLDTERFRALDAAGGDVLASVGLRAAAFVLIAVALIFLFRAAQARSDRIGGAMLGFAFLGPLLLAVQGLVAAIAQDRVASDFVAQSGPGGDVFTLLDDLAEDSAILDVASSLLFPAILGMLVGMIYISLQAMRVGLLTRFFGTLGMALGAGLIFIVPAVSLLTIVLWFLWLGLLILDRTPTPRPPAWEAGVAIPWPRPGEEPRDEEAPEEPIEEEGEATEASDLDRDHSARRERARKRKRKRRR